MNFFNSLNSSKRQTVINAVIAYYNQEKSTIPFSSREIRKTRQWLETNADDKSNRLLAEKLAMAEQITGASKNNQLL